MWDHFSKVLKKWALSESPSWKKHAKNYIICMVHLASGLLTLNTLIAKQLSQNCRKNFCSEETCRRLQQRGTPLFSLNSTLAKQQRGIHAPLTNFLSENSLIHPSRKLGNPRIFHESTATFQASNKRGCPFVTDLQCPVAFKILSQMSKDFLDPKCPFEMKVIYQL